MSLSYYRLMMKDHCTLEIFLDGKWHKAGVVELVCPKDGGVLRLEYSLEYALEHLDARDAHALSWICPVGLDGVTYHSWPGFLIDQLPQGYGRQELLRQLELPVRAGHLADWSLLKRGAGNPIGNLRIKEAADWLNERSQAAELGFTFDEVAQRGSLFLEDLAERGVSVSGSCGIQGEWPKILLTEDETGLFHLDHMLPDERARRHWLVKFARGQNERLNTILALEAPYMELARRLGLRVHARLQHRECALFIPRFDREMSLDGRLLRHGQESLYALCQQGGFGTTLSHNMACEALAHACTEPVTEILEYLKRDIANVALGNKDNHGRNTALQRRTDGSIQLTPLFDFAPMYLHPDGIARTIRWDEQDGGHPDWEHVAVQAAEATGLELELILTELRMYREKVQMLPEWMAELAIPEEVIDFLRPTIHAAVVKLGRC